MLNGFDDIDYLKNMKDEITAFAEHAFLTIESTVINRKRFTNM